MATMDKALINPLFSHCEERVELEPIVFNVPATYNAKVKIHDWQMHSLAEPRDHANVFPPVGNLHLSSYLRLGAGDIRTGISETHAMLSQVELKDQHKPIRPQRSLFHIRSLAAAEEKEEEEVKLTDLLCDPEEIRRMDYRTTMGVHYRLPYPTKTRPPPPPPPPEPWLLNRRSISYTPLALEKRDGIHKFLDDNMEVHQRVADLKKMRSRLDKLVLKED